MDEALQLDKIEDAEIVTLLQSSDAESSSDDELNPTTNKTASKDSSPGDSSVWKTAANLVNYIEGIGFLTVPYALKEGGIVALLAFIIIPIILWYVEKILTECLYDEDEKGKKRRVRSDFKDLGDALLPKYGGYVVSCVIQIQVFLLSVSYLVLCGSVMRKTLPSVPITEVSWIAITGVLVLPTAFLNSLSQIAWLSVFSVFALVVVVVSVVWYVAEHTYEWDLGTILFWDNEGVVASLSIILFSYGIYIVVPSVEKSMVEKAKFGKALALAYVVSVLMKLSFSMCAFLSFGTNTDQVVLNNLPPGPVHITVGCFFAVNCVLTYALAIYPLVQVMDNSFTTRIQCDQLPTFLPSAVVRIIIVFLTVLVAILVPDFSIIVTFMGCTVESLTGYIFPFALHLKLKYQQLKIYQVFLESVLLVFGVLITIFGITVVIRALVKFYDQ